MSSNSVCNHTRDKQVGLPLRGRPILLSLVWLQTELDSTQSYYHYKLRKKELKARAELYLVPRK